MSSSQTRFEAIQNRSDAILVPMNSTGHCTWNQKRYLATQQLNGCTAVALVSSQAGILVHIAPINPNLYGKDAPKNAEHDNARDLLQEVITAYNTYARMNVFPDPGAITVLAIHEGRVAVPVHISLIQGIMGHLKIRNTVHQYTTKQEGEARAESDISVIVEGEKGKTPKLYINGREIQVPAQPVGTSGPSSVPQAGRAVQGPSVSASSGRVPGDSQQTKQQLAALTSLYTRAGYTEAKACEVVEARVAAEVARSQQPRAEVLKQLYEHALAQKK